MGNHFFNTFSWKIVVIKNEKSFYIKHKAHDKCKLGNDVIASDMTTLILFISFSSQISD